MTWEMNAAAKAERRQSLTRQLGRIAFIHSNRVRDVSLSAHPHDPAPGWSYEGGITLSGALLPEPVTVDDVSVWLAVLMHEVGHCDVSPKTIEGTPHEVYNIAEDARQEAVMIARLPGVVGPMTQAVANLILGQPSATPSGVWPLIAGRTYLPADLRKTVRDGAVAEMGSEWVVDVARLIAQYMKLSDPGYSDLDEARNILNELAQLLDLVPDGEQVAHACGSQGSSDPPIGGVEISPEDILGDLPDSDEDEDEGEADEGADGDGEGAGKGEGEGEGDGEGEGEGDGPGEGDDEDAEGGNSGGAGLGKPTPQTPQEAAATRQRQKDVQQEAEKAAIPDETARRQAKIVLRRMKEEAHKQPQSRGLVGNTFPPSPEARGAVARLNRHLKPLIDAAEAGLDRMTSGGRIRPDRLAAGYRPDHVFDKWRLDQDDAVSAEIVVAVDTSGSMQPYGRELSEAVWILRSVVEKTAARVTVISWNTYAGVISNQVGAFPESLQITGGTNPMPMMELATSIFSKTKLRRKWLIVMTDGDVHTTTRTETLEATKALIASGVAVTAIEFGAHAKGDVFGENRRRIKSLNEIPEMIGGMLRKVYRSNVTR